jgi:hypothetical protein
MDEAIQTSGILYFAIGEKFRDEALRSAHSAKRWMPDIPIALVSDRPLEARAFDCFIAWNESTFPFLGKVQSMQLSPFERTVFIDTDTLITDAFGELFDLLARFDFAAAQAMVRLSTNRDPRQRKYLGSIPECYPEFNTGLIAYRKNDTVSAVLQTWQKLYSEQLADDVRPLTYDQLSFRQALYESNARVATLAPEYNYRIEVPNVACGRIKVVHGRHPRLAEISEKLNESQLFRISAPARHRGKGVYY